MRIRVHSLEAMMYNTSSVSLWMHGNHGSSAVS